MSAEVVSPESERKPLRSQLRAERRKVRMVQRMARTTTPDQQFVVAVDHYRATIADHATNQQAAAAATATMTRMLIDQADQLSNRRKR